jgi:hypothetical protein
MGHRHQRDVYQDKSGGICCEAITARVWSRHRAFVYHLNNPQIENRSADLRRVTGYATELTT